MMDDPAALSGYCPDGHRVIKVDRLVLGEFMLEL